MSPGSVGMTDMPWGRAGEKTTGEIVVLCKNLDSLKQAAQHFGLTRSQLLALNGGGPISTTRWLTVRAADPVKPRDSWWDEAAPSTQEAVSATVSPASQTVDPVVSKILRNAGR